MKTILATAYAVNPYKGSEDGMGWNMILQIARFQKVIAVTRENNEPKIAQYMKENPSKLYDNIQFEYFDLPYWMRFWKKGGRGAMLYYWMWQRGIVGFIQKKGFVFDIAHNLNFHNDWTPSYLWKLNKPFVWGPVGHHPKIPTQYLKDYNRLQHLKDLLTWRIKQFFWNSSTDLSKAINKADHIFCMNSEVHQVLEFDKEKSSIMPSVATQDFGFISNYKPEMFSVISAGRLVALKGFDLTIKAFASFINQLNAEERKMTELTIVGCGPELSNYKELVLELNIEENVQFIEWIDRVDLMRKFKVSSAFLFPSHEGAGMVVAEALSFGVPVVCLDNAGPGEFIDDKCGIAVKHQDYDDTVTELAKGLKKLYTDKETFAEMRINARKRFESHFNWQIRGKQLKEVYQKVVS
ncbi:hypothetical protein GCM10027429_20920 [Marivirga atlantica]|jgi:glycosyltransferase involved in cell wall biosynthesis|uniref:Glycosyltransferase n=1 Tax=Marivirga atlantica TaxID=1548457 RepID=A0A937DK79_9BACT|nr:glycosyltransferase [Marivirga atlantica]MBL0765709.1 glycosyltransferase [Marivirga atlantica]